MASRAYSGERMVPGTSPTRVEQDHVERYRFASSFVPRKRVIDIACGTGYGSKMLSEAGADHVIGVDVSPEAIEYATAHFASPSIRYIQGGIESFGDDRMADVVVCFETIEHVSTFREALLNLRRILTDSGTLVISSPNRPVTSPRCRSLEDTPSNPHHRQEFTPRELHHLLTEAGFRVDHHLYGQRLQPRLPRLASRAWARLYRPATRASPHVRPVRQLATPRYFVLVAR